MYRIKSHIRCAHYYLVLEWVVFAAVDRWTFPAIHSSEQIAMIRLINIVAVSKKWEATQAIHFKRADSIACKKRLSKWNECNRLELVERQKSLSISKLRLSKIFPIVYMPCNGMTWGTNANARSPKCNILIDPFCLRVHYGYHKNAIPDLMTNAQPKKKLDTFIYSPNKRETIAKPHPSSWNRHTN